MLSDLVVLYLFLGGTGAGLCLVLSVLGLLSPRERVAVRACGLRGRERWAMRASREYRRLFSSGFAVALVVLLLGAVCLAADLGSVDRALLLFTRPNATHLTVGAWSLSVCLVLAALSCTAWTSTRGWWLAFVRVVAVLAIVAAFVVMTYTGLLLQSVAAVPLWASPWLPVLFVMSALSCGIACALAVSQVTGAGRAFGSVMRVLASADAVVVAVEAAVVLAYVVTIGVAATDASATGAAAEVSLQQLLWGSDAWLFWGCFALVGLAVPFALDLAFARRYRGAAGVAMASAVCVLAGGLALRFCIVEAGLHPALAYVGAA